MTAWSGLTDDPAQSILGAVKHDTGKVPVYRGGFAYFPRAIEAIAAVSAFGATKYAWNGWLHVPDGFNRYTDAMGRHIIEEAKGEVFDPDSGLPHAWHTLWNSAARVELAEIEKSK